MGLNNLRSLLLAAIVLSNCITWTASRHHYTHNVSGHRSRHRRQGAGLYLSSSYVIPGGEGDGWGEWGEVSPCSRTCGGGVASQKRICLQIGSDGQPQCTGGDTKFFSCETQDCPAGSKDFREEQCSEFDEQAFRGIKYRWLPYTKSPNPCELNCMPHGERFYYRHRTKVIDGTRCNDESFDVCVNGTCQPVGCDMMLGSSAREDKCLECRGNGANCHTSSGLLDAQDIRQGYIDMLIIPEGATTIVIEEIAPSTNYLALRAKNGTYYLNGDYHIDFPRSLVIAGALWSYERSQQGFAAPDKLRSLGPTNEPLYLSLLLQDVNVGIQYEYSVPSDMAPPKNKRYNWVHEEFTPCSASCGGGFQTRNVSCRSREELELVDEGLCDAGLRPPTNQTCNTQHCPPQWVPTPWGKCSKRCGKGGTRAREVHCQKIISNGYPSIVADKECFDLLGPKPELFQECNQNATCPQWFTGPWKACDKLCDEGKQTRQVVCYYKNGRRIEVLSEDECEDESKPADQQPCMLQPCDGVDWVLSEWAGCDSCLSTVRTRIATCATKMQKVVNDSYCSYHSTPVVEEPCDKTKLPPCEVQWYATQWSKCSVDCGKGIQSRKVFCGLFDGASVLRVDDSRCAGQPKYNDTKTCEIPKEKCPSKWFAGPWSACTKKCGGGEQFRRLMCLRGEEQVSDCSGDTILSSSQTCNTGPCNTDDLLPFDENSTLVIDEYDECEEDYPEVGLDAEIGPPSPLYELMFGTSPAEGSGSYWTADTESTFDTDSSLFTDELITVEGSGTGETLVPELTDTTTDIYDTTSETAVTDTVPTSNDTESTSSDETTETGTTELTSASVGEETEESTFTTETGETDVTTKPDDKVTRRTTNVIPTEEEYPDVTESGETDKTTMTTNPIPTEEGSTESALPEETETSGSTDTTETELTGSTESTVTDSTGTGDTVSTVTEETSETSESGPSEITEETSESSAGSTEVSGTSESSTEGGTTESETIETTETGSTDMSEESTVEGSTEITTEASTTGSGATEMSSESSEGTEGSSTSEGSTLSSEAEGSTTESGTSSTDLTETGSTEGMETTETGSTVTEETGSTATEETGSTESTATEETGSTVSTVTEETGSTEATITEETGTTESTVTEETGSTESTVIEETGTTESSITEETGSTESTVTEETGSTESTVTEETGSTESTVTEETGSTESTVTGVTETSAETGSTEGTESTFEASTPEVSTISEGLTPWDLSSTVEIYTTKKARVCKPRTCIHAEFGCCPDKKTPALGPFDEGCPKPQTCKESKFGCCPDGVSPALGAKHKGCPIEPCAETLFGCCESDNTTAAEGNDQEGCPPPPPACMSSVHGCCRDGETEATGPGKEGCPETVAVTEPATTEASTVPSSTEEGEGCANSQFGCCFDKETLATGPGQQGCPCNTTEHGCCPDNVTPAQGPAQEGCPASCATTPHGCCPDAKTPAHGPDQEGCCLLYRFGCCPDNYKPADGPHLEGCGCQHSRFGCCPDKVTIASGPDNMGCGCQYTAHGCCPDKHTESFGPNFEGCGCHTYQFGCCPDGITIAKGPHGQGCLCQQSKYGCCGDGQTHATGPNKGGCDCSSSKYGCCPDGQTEANGTKFLGCSDKPENKQAACRLTFERGPCRNYSVHWYFDSEYGGCSRFWYGGCEGNGNRFLSKEECEDTCVSPPAKDACKLAQNKGACLGYNVRWYYDTDREACTNFVYGGCLGNNNNFETRELCEAQCQPERSVDQCNLSIERGTCAGNYPRWGFNKDTRACERFVWGGCEGNTNRFHTEAACMLRCNPPGVAQPECSEPQDVGTCDDKQALWSFSQSENRCVPFYYTGCGGNGNKFPSLQVCQEACPSAYVPEMCTLAADTGECANYREKWYFDTKEQRCRQFYYGGCGGNGNNFDTEQQCAQRCAPPPVTTTVAIAATAATAAVSRPRQAERPTTHAPTDVERSEFCFLEIDAGPCNQMATRWAYDAARGKCTQFQYGGCGGNRNNFPDEEYCTYYCKPAQDICQLPMLAGPCDDSLMRWFYDASSDSCSQFTYGGCEGNDNNFESRETCESRCKAGPASETPSTQAPATTPTIAIDNRISETLPPECTISTSLEECAREEAGVVWYKDPSTSACTAHQNVETGFSCRRTGVFPSQEYCERACGVFRNIDVCNYAMDAGPCRAFEPKYHYNATSGLCEEFAYGGCVGGPNRFSSEHECRQICIPVIDPCELRPEPGNCLARFVMWYYDASRDLCDQFVYGGCGGNENRFESREACEGRCVQQAQPVSTTTTTVAPQQSNLQPLDTYCQAFEWSEPCDGNATIFHFDPATGACQESDRGGCRHSNGFRTEEECERQCGAFRGLDACQTRLDPGPCRASIPKFYFDTASGSCREYAYGGCGGGPNRFSTVEECEDVCAGAGPDRSCLREVETGDTSCGATPQRRWHYSVTHADCIVFAYQGCGGNDNNFASYQECAQLCRVITTGTDDSAICDRYSEECQSLETQCESGVTITVAPEGCERCSCEEPVNCDVQSRECDQLRCPYGVERTPAENGCETCKCYEDPCARANCAPGERCVAASYRDPQIQEVQYSAHCVPEIETNEVLPDCEQFESECASLVCPYGVQRTRSAGGCERCACVQTETDCEPHIQDCERLKCAYGLTRIKGDDGCERCKCLEHPCANKQCPAGERCVARPYRDPVSGEPLYSADCNTLNKPGLCPVSESHSTEGACRRECNDDADCRGVGKCCSTGCSRLCLAPAPLTTTTEAMVTTPVTTHRPETPQAPQANTEQTEPEVTASEGGKATLRCLFHGNPPPRITWRRGEITIDGDVDRYRLHSDGALEIVSLYRNDSGVYICVADNGVGTAHQEVRLQVNDPVTAPAGIAGSPRVVVTGELSRPLVLRCLAYGFPEPDIYWFRGVNGPMVPFSSTLYEVRKQVLHIRRLALETLGEYECQAFNGQGKPATQLIVVQAYRTDDDDNAIISNQYLVPRQRVVEVTPPRHFTDATTTTTMAPEPEVEIPQYTVPVRTKLLPTTTTIYAGSELSLPCEVDGYPEPEVFWTKDGVRLTTDDRVWITGTRLTIRRALVNDSGEYGCHARNSYDQHSSAVQIDVQGLYIPSNCTDNQYFATCPLIVKSNFCKHKYYSRFCCRSCVEAGQLDPRDVEMQADEPFRKK